MDQLRIIKRYRSEKDPDLQSNEGKSISACSRDDLDVIANKIGLPLDDIFSYVEWRRFKGKYSETCEFWLGTMAPEIYSYTGAAEKEEEVRRYFLYGKKKSQ